MRVIPAAITLSLACAAQTGSAGNTSPIIPEAERAGAPVPPYTPPTPPRRLDQLPPVQINTACFAGEREEARMRGYGGAGAASGAATRGAMPAMPKAAPAPQKSAEAAPPPPGRPAAEASAAADGTGDLIALGYVGGAEDEVAANEPARRDDRDQRRPEVQQPRGPAIDWGGVVHLSNDDAMSLASAQRLLWALDRGARFTLDQIRPHELLNYFTFDTAPQRGETFSVAASAQQTGPDQLALALAVQGATPPRPDLDLTLLVDRSGSMSAEGRMSYTQRALSLVQQRLQPGDRVDLVLFDHEVCTPVRDFVVGRDDPALLRRAIEQTTPRGSTDLDLGLREAYQVATSHAGPDRAGRVMVFTDAILNTGDVNPHTVTEVGRHLDERGIRLTGVGVGSEFRDDVLNRLTEKGKGAYVFLGSERVVDRLFDKGFDSLVQTIAEDVRFSLDLPDSLGMKKFYGEESSRDPADVQPVSFQAGATQVFFQDLAVRDGRLDARAPITLTMRWTDPANGAARSQTTTVTVGDALRADPHNVTKAKALMAWSDVLMTHAVGGPTCDTTFGPWKAAVGAAGPDAELGYLDGLISRFCGTWQPAPPPWQPITRAPTKVRVDADQPVSAVDLRCAGHAESATLTGSDTVATFNAPAGRCDVTLYGAVPMTQTIDVPPTGADVRCVIRAGRVSCG